MKCFGEMLERPGASNDKLVAAWTKVAALKPSTSQGAPIKETGGSIDKEGTHNIYDLPISHWTTKKTTVSCCDLLMGVEGEFCFDDIEDKLKTGSYNELPSPFCPKIESEVPVTMSLHVSKGVDGKYLILKHFQFLKAEKVAVIERELIQGIMCAINWVPDRHGTLKTFQYIFERLGGLVFKHWKWDTPHRAKVATSDDVQEKKEKIRKGIQHLKDDAPRGNFDCEQTEWLECELLDPESPIYDFKRELIDKVLRSLRDRDHFATKQDYYPCLLPDVRGEYRELVYKILQLLLTTTLLCIGEAKFGKTPLMTIMAFALARLHALVEEQAGRKVTPAVRISSEMDFFRGEAGLKWVPCIFDDGDLSEQRPKVLKAFFDPTQAEAMTYVRWGAAKFIRGQARFGGDNAYDASAEPTHDQWFAAVGFASSDEEKAMVTTQFLMDMLVPAFPKGMSPSNVGAMLKRCSILLNTKNHVYLRLAGLNSIVEKHVLLPGYLEADSGAILHKWQKTGVQRDPEEYDRLLAFEKRTMADLLNCVFQKNSDVREATAPALVGSRSSSTSGSSGRVVKREMVDAETKNSVWKKAKSWNLTVASSASINLRSPPRPSRVASQSPLDEFEQDPFGHGPMH
jgi:hypothetical protein